MNRSAARQAFFRRNLRMRLMGARVVRHKESKGRNLAEGFRSEGINWTHRQLGDF
jgi:hypothetical protein